MDLLALATDVLHAADDERAATDPAGARRSLWRFSTVLGARNDERLRTLHCEFLAFAEWWMEPDAIESEPERYAVEVGDVMPRIRLAALDLR